MNWVDGTTPANATNLNHAETQYDQAAAYSDALRADPTKEIEVEVVATLTGETPTAGRVVLVSSNKFLYGGNGSVWGLIGSEEATTPITAGDVLLSHIGFVNGAKITGTMPNKAGTNVIVATTNDASRYIHIVPPAGFYDGAVNTKVTADDADFIAANIKNGVNIFGITGNYDYETPNQITPGEVLLSHVGFVNGDKIIGTMPNNVSPATTLTTQGATQVVPAGYSPGGTIAATLTNLVAANIKQGTVVGGITGTYDYETPNQITAGDVVSPHVGFVNGAKITGTVVEKVGSATVITPTLADQAIPAGRYGGAVGDGKVSAMVIPHSSQTYGTPGTYTFTIPTNVTQVTFAADGAGGGGGGGYGFSGGGGGAGGEYMGNISTTPGGTLSVVVGVGGAGGSAGVAGSVGGNSSVSTYIGYGGSGGGGGAANYGGYGGHGGGGGGYAGTGGNGGAGGVYSGGDGGNGSGVGGAGESDTYAGYAGGSGRVVILW